MRHLGLLTAFALLVAPAPAVAQNHFLLELEGGFATPVGVGGDRDSGYGYSGTFGFGGRIRGFSPAYYLVGRVGRSELAELGPKGLGRARLLREQTELAGGGRIYLPITNRARVMLQIAFGETYESARISRSGFVPLSLDEDMFTLFGQAGVQYRFTDHLSLGAGFDAAWMFGEDPDLAAKAAGIVDNNGDRGRVRLGLTATFHF